VDPSRGELRRNLAGRLLIEGEQQDAGGGLVEAMHWIDTSADLVADLLQRKAGLPLVDEAAVDEQAGRLVHRHQARVLIQDVQVVFPDRRTARVQPYHPVIGAASRYREQPAKSPPASDLIESIGLFVEEWRLGLGRMNALTGSAAGVA
jgi:hypothetical protein